MDIVLLLYSVHGFSARIIQNELAQFPIPDEAYSTGYKKWNTQTGQYEIHQFSSPGKFPAPVKTGVAVATLLGGYEPGGSNAVIYPVFHGNYGNVFDLPEPNEKAWPWPRIAMTTTVSISSISNSRLHSGRRRRH